MWCLNLGCAKNWGGVKGANCVFSWAAIQLGLGTSGRKRPGLLAGTKQSRWHTAEGKCIVSLTATQDGRSTCTTRGHDVKGPAPKQAGEGVARQVHRNRYTKKEARCVLSALI